MTAVKLVPIVRETDTIYVDLNTLSTYQSTDYAEDIRLINHGYSPSLPSYFEGIEIFDPPTEKPIEVTFKNGKEYLKYKFDSLDVQTAIEADAEGMSKDKIKTMLGTNMECIEKLFNVIDKRRIKNGRSKNKTRCIGKRCGEGSGGCSTERRIDYNR